MPTFGIADQWRLLTPDSVPMKGAEERQMNAEISTEQETSIASAPTPLPPTAPGPGTSVLPVSAASKPTAIRVDASLGTVVVLSEAAQIQLMTLEYNIDEAIARGWNFCGDRLGTDGDQDPGAVC